MIADIYLAAIYLVCHTAVFSVVTQRSSPLVGRSVAHDTKNGSSRLLTSKIELNFVRPFFGRNPPKQKIWGTAFSFWRFETVHKLVQMTDDG